MGKYLDDLKGQVAAAEGKIDGMYLELGKKCYELYADSPDEAIKDEMRKSNYSEAYENTYENVKHRWHVLMIFALVFAALSVIALEFIDKDKR